MNKKSLLLFLGVFQTMWLFAYNVTFQVDMQNVSGFTTPEVNGTFNGWCGNCNAMTDANSDGVWEVTIDLPVGSYEYKFSYDNWAGQETLTEGSACTVTNSGFTNRTLTVSADETLPVVCWAACVSCDTAPPSYNVTFQVDMQNETGFSIPEVNGTFNGWCGNCNALSDANGDGIWEITLNLPEGSYEYKFSHDAWAGQETLIQGGPCTVTNSGFTNRLLDLNADVVLSPVCYGSCNSCNSLPVNYDVTFQVNMQNITGFTTPEVNGTFNGWCGNCNAMADVDGDGIWSVTVSIPAGNYEYKFTYDNWAGQEALIEGSSCTVTNSGFTNRSLTVDADVTLPAVCWESCEVCPSTSLVQMDLPVTFEIAGVDYGVTSFGNTVSTIVTDPTDASNTAVQVVKTAAAATWAGTTITTVVGTTEIGLLNAIPITPTQTRMSIRVWSPDAGIPVRLKVEDHTDPTHSVEAEVLTTTSNTWETLVYDFSNEANGTAQLNFAYMFDKASIFFNFGTDGATAGEKTYYFDDLMMYDGIVEPTTYAVTFQLDMQNETGFTTPEVNGTFNGWCGNCNAMSDIDGDGVWTVTVDILAGTYEYKFAYDNWAGQETLIEGSSCTVTNSGFTNRSLVVDADVTLPVVCWASCTACNITPASYAVTFQLDMQNETGFTTPEVNGTFNGWCGNCNAMSDVDGDGIWTVTVDMPAGTYEYKFAYDNWAGQETLIEGSSCTVTNSGFTNRSLVVDADATLPVVCWASCTACNVTPASYAVTFQLDMQNETGFTTPEVNGTFNGWCGNCNAMSDVDGDGIWTVTVDMPAGTYEYKFAYDNWAGQETLIEGSSCTVTNSGFTNRSLVVDADATLPVVCWASCTACNVTPASYAVTFQLDMQNETGFTTPEVNGTFNGWCGNCNAMSDVDGDGIWTVTIDMPAGTYEYKFAYDNWAGQETLLQGSSCTVTNSGFTNRSLVVDADATLPVVCWASCTACNVTPASYAVTFQLDMQNVSGFTTPEVNGTFNGWCGNCNAMSDVDGDGIWTVTVDMPAGTYEYKFAYDNWAGQETLLQGSSCTVTNSGFTNRSLVVDADATLPVVCWASCTACNVTPASYAVTFQLDMQNETGFTTPEVNGTFNGWCGNCNAMSDVDGDGIWTVTVDMPAGTYEYKFAYDNWAGQETLLQGSSCTVTNSGFTNRSLVVDADATLPVVCWASCTACNITPASYAVTFQLDMQNVSGFTTPEVNGTFNGWCGNCNAMSDVDGDGIWTVTVDMPAGTYEYKFAYDNWAGQETLLQGSSCTVTNSGFTNRALVVDADVTLPVVCWAACTSCETAPQYHSVTFQVDMQNVSGFTTPEVNGTFNGWCGNCFQMSDVDGDGIWTATTQLQEGSYEYKFSHDAWAGQEEMTPGSSCTITNSGFTNRYLQLLSDTTLNVVCWASCDACVEPTPVAVTFQLDASQVGGTTEAAISGNFNAYCADCAPMTLNSGIWSTTQMLLPGVYEYYFTLNNGTISENLQDGVCTVNNNNVYHRIITVTDATTVDVVCFNSCSACIISVDEIESNELVMFPNPANNELHVQGTAIADGVYSIRNAAGQMVENGKTVRNQNLTIQVSRFESGVYTISIPSAAGMTNKTFVVLR